MEPDGKSRLRICGHVICGHGDGGMATGAWRRGRVICGHGDGGCASAGSTAKNFRNYCEKDWGDFYEDRAKPCMALCPWIRQPYYGVGLKGAVPGSLGI